MLAVTEKGVRKITVMGPTQLLKTELINNIVGYCISGAPRPLIVMQPSGKLAEAWSKDRLDPMVRDTPVLQGLLKDKRSKDGDNTILRKAFPGGVLTVVSSGSASDVASRPVSLVLMDEVDKYESTREGDPIKLLEERTDTFWNALTVRVCSPTIKGASRIETEYLLSDQREFHGKCPHCGEYEWLKWSQVKWNKEDPEATAHYECSHCEKPWTETERLLAISRGKYIAQAPFNGHAGFHVNKIASPWQPLSVLVRKFYEAKNDPEKLKTFLNTQLAETFEEQGEAPESQRLYERRESYPTNSIPPGVLFLTAGVDVQGGESPRFEVEIVGWTRDKQSYSIDYRVIPGDTNLDTAYSEKLNPLLNEIWRDASGRELQIRMLAIDTGYATQRVYNWVRTQSADRVRAVDGRAGMQTLTGTPSDVDRTQDGKRLRRSLQLWPVGVDVAKSELYGWLQLDMPEDGKPFPPGYCHFPQYDLEHFKRLTAEKLVKRVINGRVVYRWILEHSRNEQLDIRNYARAAAAMFGMDRFSDEEWDMLAGKYDVPETKHARSEDEEPDDEGPQRPKSDYWARQRGKKLF